MQRRMRWMAVALTSVWGACAIEPVEGGDPAEATAVSAISRGPCPDAGCGENSPVIDALGFHEQNLKGVANTESLFIVPKNGPSQIVQRGTSYDLVVSHNMITAAKSGVTKLAGRALEGAIITVQKDSQRYSLKIKSVRPMQFFLPPYDPLETYELTWAKEHDDHFVNLCGGIQLLLDEGLGDGGKVHPELMNMTVWEAVVFEGDRIVTATKTISKNAEDDWFNIGCATSTPAKLLLTHHTIHTQSAPKRAWEQRQAMLKLYVADYCGTGDSFTVARQTLVWMSKTVGYLYPAWKLEARWNEMGATCLNNPRMLYPSTPLGPVYFPNISAALAAAGCHPPSCTNLDTSDLDDADRMSSNPMP